MTRTPIYAGVAQSESDALRFGLLDLSQHSGTVDISSQFAPEPNGDPTHHTELQHFGIR